MKDAFDLDAMREIKRGELPEIRSLLGRRIPRERPVIPFRCAPREDNGIIAEIKRSSPTRGDIRRVSPADQADLYISGGACALSVLTDSVFFGGSWRDLYSVALGSTVPVLCKEFIYYREQVDLAWCLGADMVLLIARVLSREELADL